MAVRSPQHPQVPDRPDRRRRLRAMGRRRGRVLPAQARRQRLADHRRRGRRLRPALLRRPRPHPHVRPPHHRLHGDEPARLEQLRQRPRRRQRPIRAELRLLRCADHRRPCDHPALPALHVRGRARNGRHLHAQALRRTHRFRSAPSPFTHLGRKPGLPERSRRR
ncbi:Uncharacterised protein [Mycobacteroides abscessus subsp. abscessus]|nr:Uncharacterised protein [Mycobacteroides abscessus subsp. abscessus]